MKTARLVFVILVMLSACTQATSTSTPISISEEPIATVSSSLTPTPASTETPSNTATPTEWTKTYPTKKALVVYGVSSRNQMTQLFMDRGDFYFSPFLTLYADGQLIFGPGVYEKRLSQKEIDAVFMKLKQLGFFALQDAYSSNYQSLFYTDSINPFIAEIGTIEITVNNGQVSKNISIGTNNEEYLIQPMKDIVTYLKSFSTNGAKPYQLDRVLVGIETEKQLSWLHDATAMSWPSDLTPPSQSSRYDGVLYLEGTEALKLYKFIKKNPGAVFIFKGIKFQVSLRPILPNECHIYHYHELRIEIKNTQPYFTCDGW